jgi:hypothetical protein
MTQQSFDRPPNALVRSIDKQSEQSKKPEFNQPPLAVLYAYVTTSRWLSNPSYADQRSGLREKPGRDQPPHAPFGRTMNSHGG